MLWNLETCNNQNILLYYQICVIKYFWFFEDATINDFAFEIINYYYLLFEINKSLSILFQMETTEKEAKQ